MLGGKGKAAYRTETCAWGGQYFTILVNSHTRIPHPSLVLYADDLGATHKANTLRNYVRDVGLLLEWCDANGIDLDSRFMALEGLTRSEVRRLGQALTRKSDNSGLCAYSTFNRRLTAIGSYCSFQMDRYLDRCGRDYQRFNAGRTRKDALLKSLRRLAVDEPEIEATTKVTKTLTRDVFEIFESILHPNSELNPFKSHSIRLRNYALFNLALASWGRRAELVLLELQDLDLTDAPLVKIRRKPKGVRNKRKDGADLKTRARDIPISTALAQLVNVYILESRPLLAAGRNPSSALFISGKDGDRLSSGTVNYILDKASQVAVAALGAAARVHPHMLRATGASEFRRRYQESVGPKAVSGELVEILTYIGGWSQSSGMPRRYTRQVIIEKIRRLVTEGRDQ